MGRNGLNKIIAAIEEGARASTLAARADSDETLQYALSTVLGDASPHTRETEREKWPTLGRDDDDDAAADDAAPAVVPSSDYLNAAAAAAAAATIDDLVVAYTTEVEASKSSGGGSSVRRSVGRQPNWKIMCESLGTCAPGLSSSLRRDAFPDAGVNVVEGLREIEYGGEVETTGKGIYLFFFDGTVDELRIILPRLEALDDVTPGLDGWARLLCEKHGSAVGPNVLTGGVVVYSHHHRHHRCHHRHHTVKPRLVGIYISPLND